MGFATPLSSLSLDLPLMSALFTFVRWPPRKHFKIKILLYCYNRPQYRLQDSWFVMWPVERVSRSMKRYRVHYLGAGSEIFNCGDIMTQNLRSKQETLLQPQEISKGEQTSGVFFLKIFPTHNDCVNCVILGQRQQ